MRTWWNLFSNQYFSTYLAFYYNITIYVQAIPWINCEISFFTSQQRSQTQTPPRQPDFDSTASGKGQKSANSSEQLAGSKRSVNENEVQVNNNVWLLQSVTVRFIFLGSEHYCQLYWIRSILKEISFSI